MKRTGKPDVPVLDFQELQSNFSHDGVTMRMRVTDYSSGKPVTVEVQPNHNIEGPAPFPLPAWPARRNKGR